MKTLIFLFALLAGVQAADLLEPEQAFRFSARAVDDGAVEVRFAIADGYYLYRDRLRFSAEGNARLGQPALPAGIPHKDEFFGEMPIYRGKLSIRLPVQGEGRFELKVVSQGCADAGVCYAPMESKATLQLAGASAALPSAPRLSLYASEMDIARLLQGNLALVLGGFLVLGLLLAFTPCMLPMMNKSRALGLSLIYVFSMALTYALAGIGAAYAGSLIAAYLQNVWVLGGFALIFVALALSMFGLYELRLPGFLHERLHESQGRLQGGRIASVAAMGVFSAIIVSPCVSAPLAGTLLQISRSGDVLLGGAALFALAIGMGLPLIAVGVSEGALLPKAGAWMQAVRKFFGVLLLAVALWILTPLLSATFESLAWGALFVGSAIYLGVLRTRSWLLKGVGVIAVVAGVALVVSAFTAGDSASRTAWTRIASVAELDQRLVSPGRPVMLDFYADWCVSCKEMEKLTFSDPRVRAELDRMLLLQADVTAANEADRALLKRFSLFGPPGIIFFDSQGREIAGLRVIGYQPAERFLKTLAASRAK
ncbi:MAG: protein-disulfide reductase DsbD [Betaproteobacteria bacterium]|nr:MAG: protein-disulfide reductase DsbD [Betaproteobacteria bacterium]